MQHKRLKLSALFFLGLGLTSLQAQTMYVRQTSGTQIAYTLGNIKKMSFSSGNITVSKTVGSADTYALGDLRYLNFADLTTSIAETDKKDIAMLLFPNPVVDFLNIQLSTKGSQSYVIKVLSIDGREVYKEKINRQNNVYQINISMLPKGIYLCKVYTGTSIETRKFIKN